ncbi:unnamed protein product [Allacma fusca]|uniref:F-ATPase gamma subunit n=1 Tax=Allacma fusca TaxID=39272 RepID=A0A8J2PWS4_9HEXA|nr:unnamed protein product [Allacma fusca]
MVSAAKYSRAERELKLARPFGVGATAFYEKAEVQAPEDEAAPKLVLAMTSDRGLCGAVHSSVAKSIKSDLGTSAGASTKVVCVGDKSRALLQRLYGGNILFSAKEIGRIAPTFADASKIAEAVLNSGYKFEGGKIVFNRFKSVVSYETSALPLYSNEQIISAPKVSVYDSIDADVLQSHSEFQLAAQIFYAMKENSCSEQSSRMTAMDNASKNAGEMIDKLSLTFNRTRQAVITRELIEIISGAAALD